MAQWVNLCNEILVDFSQASKVIAYKELSNDDRCYLEIDDTITTDYYSEEEIDELMERLTTALGGTNILLENKIQ